jgi:hypothetical protein
MSDFGKIWALDFRSEAERLSHAVQSKATCLLRIPEPRRSTAWVIRWPKISEIVDFAAFVSEGDRVAP